MTFAFDLESIAAIAGVRQVVIADDAGRLLDCAGWDEPPTAAILVLAHATLAAASELGRRSGSGDCLEVVQQHEGGCIYLHALPHRRVLLVRCHSEASIPAVRHVSQVLLAADVQALGEMEAEGKVSTPRAVMNSAGSNPSSRISDLSAAFLAEPAW